ncbi:MAG: hypothetical protein WDW38_008620 [Sanguina aurantia]
MKASDATMPCPCGSTVTYKPCCGRVHDGAAAATAEQLMRARYSAYVLKREDFLLASWHANSRPPSLHLAAQQPQPNWLGLDIRQHHNDDDNHSTVEFVARYRLGGAVVRPLRLHGQRAAIDLLEHRQSGAWYCGHPVGRTGPRWSHMRAQGLSTHRRIQNPAARARARMAAAARPQDREKASRAIGDGGATGRHARRAGSACH